MLTQVKLMMESRIIKLNFQIIFFVNINKIELKNNILEKWWKKIKTTIN